MNKNVLSIRVATATFILTVVVIAAIVLYFQLRSAFASSFQPVSQADANEALVDMAVPTNTPAAQAKYPLVQQVNGVTMQVLGTASKEGYFMVDVCFNFPDKQGSWLIGGSNASSVTLSNGDWTIPAEGWGIIGDFKKDADGNWIGRCDNLRFPVSADTKLDKLTLTISRVGTMMPDVPDCATAQKKLDEAKQNIEVKCADSQIGTGMGGGFSVTNKPADMSDAAAYLIAVDAFIDVVEGPWVFSLN